MHRSLPNVRSLALFSVVLAAAIVAAQSSGHATEIDSFTGRYDPRTDALATLNDITAAWLVQAVEAANLTTTSCDTEVLYAAVHDAFVGAPLASVTWSTFEREMMENDALDRRNGEVASSVYRGVDDLDRIILTTAGLGPTVRIGEYIVGADKFGHFLSEGYRYYEQAYVEAEGIESALALGMWTEEQFYGLRSTGVYSYADLSANFRGMQFWARLIGDLVPTDYPYVACVAGEWLVAAKFDWRDYVDAAWDEALNCSTYRSRSMTAAVLAEQQRLETTMGQRYVCPISEQACADLVQDNAFGQYYDVTIGPGCLAAAASLGSVPATPPSNVESLKNSTCAWVEYLMGAQCHEQGCACSSTQAADLWPFAITIMALFWRTRRRGRSAGAMAG